MAAIAPNALALYRRVKAKKADGVTPDPTKNGKWFAVLASGPTGPIDTSAHQFKGTSNQNLTIYVLDLVTGAVAATIDTLTDGTKLTNAFAGSITCALFLQRFVENAKSWLHIDIFAWTPSAKPARPEGGECQAARALYKLLSERYA